MGGRRAVPVNVVKGSFIIAIEDQVVASFVIYVECTKGFWRHDVVNWKSVLLTRRWTALNR